MLLACGADMQSALLKDAEEDVSLRDVACRLVPSGNFPLLLCWPALAMFVLFANLIERIGLARLKTEKKVRCS